MRGTEKHGIILIAREGGFVAYSVRAGTVFMQGKEDVSRFLQANALKVAEGPALPAESLPMLANLHQPEAERPGGPIGHGGILLLSGRQLFHLEDWIAAYSPGSIVVTGHWKAATQEKYRQQAQASGCKVVFLEEEGVLFLNEN